MGEVGEGRGNFEEGGSVQEEGCEFRIEETDVGGQRVMSNGGEDGEGVLGGGEVNGDGDHALGGDTVGDDAVGDDAVGGDAVGGVVERERCDDRQQHRAQAVEVGLPAVGDGEARGSSDHQEAAHAVENGAPPDGVLEMVRSAPSEPSEPDEYVDAESRDEEDDVDNEEEGNVDDQWEDVPSSEEEAAAEEEADEEKYPWGCEHYRRRCRIVAPCCGEVFWCRHCHNEKKGSHDLKNAHEIDRFAVAEIVCEECGTRQPPASNCAKEGCGITFAVYFCAVCKFWDEKGLKKETFHCDKCGICRVGGRDNFFHCDVCGACYANALQGTHRCLQQAMKRLCPICLEDMFNSTRQSSVLKCGHAIHADCLRHMSSHCRNFVLKCPTCSKTISHAPRVTEEIDRLIAAEQMPPELVKDVKAFCNDCEMRFECSFHFLGLKCPHCGFYNTVQTDEQ